MKIRLPVIAGAALLASASASHALTFNFTFLAGSTPQANQAFIDAGARWSALFSDNLTVNMTVGTASLGNGMLASASTAQTLVSYTDYRNALVADARSATDATATSNLPTGSSFGMLINNTSDSPNGSASTTAYLDNNGSANNSSIRLTNANAKALGLTPTAAAVGSCATACDASIAFSNAISWDYNPNDGITSGTYDFVGSATHEIGHALGFISGVDILDANSFPIGGPFPSDAFTYVAPLDLYRFSAASMAAGSGIIDWTASTTDKFFSLNKGAAAGPSFSTGVNFGDGRQNGHWKDNLGLGIMDPTVTQGELLSISDNDITAFDVIGWNVSAVPEPSTWALFAAGLAGLVARRRRTDLKASAV
jgi:hypothetical protein